MPELQQQPDAHAEEKLSNPIDTPRKPWTLPATHRRPGVVWLIALLIVLQLVLGWLLAVQAQKVVDLGARIERLEKSKR
jgi:hypothetical protein